MPKGNIVLIPFPYTDLSGSKLRPALVLTENTLDVTVCFITTQLQWQEPIDIVIQPKTSNGIKKLSIIRLSKLATIDRNLIVGIIGNIDQVQTAEVNTKLKPSFSYPNIFSATSIPLVNAASTVPIAGPSYKYSPAKYKVSSTGSFNNFLAFGVSTVS